MTDTRQKQDQNFAFYHEYCRLYLANTVLLTQMRQLFNERNEYTTRFEKLRRRGEDIGEGKGWRGDGKKRHRRTAHEIDRHYRCPVTQCHKSYGSEGSLNQHIKRKHQEYYYAEGLGGANEQSYMSSFVSK